MLCSWRILRAALLLFLLAVFLGGAAVPVGGLTARVRAFTLPIEFDFATWTLDATAAKLLGWGLSIERFLSPQAQSALVLDYLAQVQTVNQLNAELLIQYADPTVRDPDAATRDLQVTLAETQDRLNHLAGAAETILQTQLMTAIHDVGLGFSGQVFPPSLYRSSDVPHSLIVSPRTEIVPAAEISLLPGLTTDGMDALEDDIALALDHAALVVPIGGIGTYPTMVMQTTDIVWLTEVIAHEWVHNYLTLRPLGMNYYTSSELRTINETTASLAGKELGRMILEKYYPAYLPPEAEPETEDVPLPITEPDPEAFDFRVEMRITRVEVDRLLAEGEVEQAETYMEARREFFWENGYLIRKLNQAYFAFYGAYNDDPGGGASGEDPVGPAVVAFRSQFSSLDRFLNAISWVTSFEELASLLET